MFWRHVYAAHLRSCVTLQVTTDAIVHAVTSAHPHRRYVVANVNGAPAWLLVRLAQARDSVLNLRAVRVRKCETAGRRPECVHLNGVSRDWQYRRSVHSGLGRQHVTRLARTRARCMRRALARGCPAGSPGADVAASNRGTDAPVGR
jgi:hypothetical protein